MRVENDVTAIRETRIREFWLALRFNRIEFYSLAVSTNVIWIVLTALS
jgi:hypothetical protein